MSGGPLTIAVVCEAEADFRTAGGISDRVLGHAFGVDDDPHPDGFRRWVEWQGRPFLGWIRVKVLARALRIKAHGHFAGEPGAPDALTARRAIRVVRRTNGDASAILLIRDSDGDTSRRTGLEQARSDSPLKDRIVIGFCHRNRECWVLAGYVPSSKSERKLLESVIADVGFDPCRGADRLRGKRGELRNTKRILRQLTAGDFERERLCWTETDLQTLETRGAAMGLSEFIADVRARLVPLLPDR